MKILILVSLILSGGILMGQNERTEHWYERNQLFNQELSVSGPAKNVFLGNSITEGFDLEYFFPGIPVVNRGIAGDHIDGLLERLDNSVLKLKPARLYVLIGINDIGRSDPDSLILSRFTILLDSISTLPHSTEIYLTSILPTSSSWANCPPEKIIRLNQAIEKLSDKYKMNWLNLYPLYVSEDSSLKPELTSDGLHLNQAGYQIWANELNKTGIIK